MVILKGPVWIRESNYSTQNWDVTWHGRIIMLAHLACLFSPYSKHATNAYKSLQIHHRYHFISSKWIVQIHPNTGNRNKLLASSGECFCPKAARNESKWSAMFSWFDFDTGGRPADFGLCDSYPNIGLHEAQAYHVHYHIYHSHWCLFTTQADWIQVERENHNMS